MKPIQEFLLELSEQDIRLWLEGESLHCNAPQDTLTAALRDELIQRKAEIIAFLSQTSMASEAISEVIPLAPPDTDLPLSLNQQGVWFKEQLEENLATYNQSFAVALKGQLNIGILERSLQEIIIRHSILRTNFISKNGKPIQIFQAFNDFQLSQVNISHLTEIEQQAEIEQFTIDEIQRPFNLAQDQLFRISLLRLGNESHVLLFVMHHLVADGWSSGVLIKELGILYKAFLAGNPSPLAELSIQYADFAYWQQQQLETVLEKHLTYWLQQLDGAPPLLQLPTDRPRQSIKTNYGEAANLTIGADLTRQLKQVSQQHGVTLFTLLLTAFQVLLYRYTNQSDLCVGTTIANRDRRLLEPLIGLLVNPVVIRTDLSGDPSFQALLKPVQQIVYEAQNHNDLPFHILVEKLQPQRDMSYTPLFQVAFVLLAAGIEDLQLPNLEISRWETPVATVKLDLNLSMQDTATGLIGRFEYNTDLFDAATIIRMVGHFKALLLAIATNSKQRISTLPLLTQAEQHQLLVEWNNTQTDYPRNKCIHQLFEEQVKRKPNAIAVVFREKRLTYCELNNHANQLAHYLKTLGVGPNVLVGICVERSLEMIIGLLAILKAGGVYVPLDPSYPSERLAFMLDDTKIAILLTTHDLAESVNPKPAHLEHVIHLDTDLAELNLEAIANLKHVSTATDLAYVMYTSGSTGQPKGVEVRHRGVVRLVQNPDYVSMSADDVFLQLAPIAFDAATLEIWGALLNGAQLVLFPEQKPSPETIGLVVAEHQVTLLWLTAGLFHLMVDYGLDQLKSVRYLLAGGDVLSVSHVQRALEHLEKCSLINGYGPTENTTFTCCYNISSSVLTGKSIPIGRPIANTQVYVLDSHHQPVPMGVPGELYAGGDGLARGYFNRPELSKQRFIAHPFSSDPHARLYRTGDLVRYLPDGTIEFLERLDTQIKIRGFRIELGEIEAALMQHPQVQAGVVVVREDRLDDKRLVAYVTSHDLSPSVNELHRFLKDKLPDYMVPSAFVVLEALPLTPNGKIDRQALPTPDTTHYNHDQAMVAPRDPIERAIAEIWTQVLEIDQVSIHDDFFELGGHSLIATQIITRIEATFGIELSLSNLFDTPTVAELAVATTAALQTTPKHDLPPIRKSCQIAQPPLSFAQARLVFLQKLQPNNPFYNIAISIHLQGVLNVDALEQSLSEILRRHDSLRTCFLDEGEHTYAIVSDFSEFTLPIIDLSKLPKVEQETETELRLTEAACQPFDLNTDQLVRVKLLRLHMTDHLMLLTMHHSIADGWSINIFMRELLALYEAFSTGSTSSLPELPIQYVDFAIWQKQYLQEALLESELAYWKRQLADAPPLLQLPTDKPRPSIQTFSGSAQLFTLPKTLVEALRLLSQQSESTLFMTLLAAFKILLHRYTSMVDILIGIPIANRSRVDVESLIGYFVNTLVLRTDLSGNPSFRDLLARVRKIALEAYGHQNLPFEKLLEELKLERNLGHSPLFQVMFSFEDTLELHFDTPNLTFDLSPIDTNTSKFDLSLHMVETESGLMGRLEYNTDIFEIDRIKRLIGHFEVLLEGIIEAPSQSISELSLLTSVEKQQFSEWNNTQADFPHFCCIHDLFEAQVEQTPDAIAAVFDDQRLTYVELNQRANDLANYLQTLNVKPDTLVGVYLDRSLDMLVGLLGILKAGAAYLPLDPNYPKERLSSIVLDSQILVLLTQQHLLRELPGHPAHVLCLDTEWDLISQTAPCSKTKPKHSNHLAYVIYTSGSTGKPKGVKITHQNVVNFLVAMQHELPITSADILLSVTSISFDISVLELFLPLITGACVVMVSRQVAMDGQQLNRYLTTSKASLMQATPATWRLLLASGWQGNAQLKILCGGEALPCDLANQLLAKGTGVWNLYGPTETTIWSTVHKIDATQLSNHTVAIGRPIANTQVLVLDSSGHSVPLGLPGELHIAGMGVSPGYWNRPELTAEKFISHPHAGRLYKTGDLVKFLSNGTLEYLGRTDYQIKLRGFRIEPGEIEATLITHPAVQEAVVVAQTESSEHKRLIGYVVMAKECSTSWSTIVSELKPFLRSQLPDYMVPSAFVVLDTFPLTPNGKIDRLALPQPDKQAISDTTYIAPKTSIERKIASVWQELLQLEDVSRNANFFSLGGHSLLLMKMQVILSKDLDQDIEIVDLFQYPTIELLANHVSQSHHIPLSVQQAQDRIATRQESQSVIAQARQMRKQNRATHK